MNVKLLLADDHPMLRHGMRQALAQLPQLMLLGEASTAAEVLKLTQELAPDLVVMDVHLPDMNGVEASRRIFASQPSTKVIIFSSDPSRTLVDEALQAGVCGYVLKSGIVEELVHAIELVMEGKLYLSPDLNAGVLEDYRKHLSGESALAKPTLSARERNLLWLVAEGQRNKEIAARLSISVKSVEAYRSRIMKKLGCSNAVELVRYAIREGIVMP